MALDGKTPADKVWINVKGKDKWIIIIQNANRREGNLEIRMLASYVSYRSRLCRLFRLFIGAVLSDYHYHLHHRELSDDTHRLIH